MLEKSRVVIRAQGERAFHIFYQLIAGSDQGENGRMSLGRDANKFEYLKKSQCTTVPSINDSNDFHEVNQSLDILGFSGEDKKTMWSILAGILHLGNVNFSTAAPGAAKTGESKTNIANPADAEKAATLWSCDANLLKKALVNRSINTGVGRRASTIQIPLDQAQVNIDSIAALNISNNFFFIRLLHFFFFRLFSLVMLCQRQFTRDCSVGWLITSTLASTALLQETNSSSEFWIFTDSKFSKTTLSNNSVSICVTRNCNNCSLN